jgi:hypothetical protein
MNVRLARPLLPIAASAALVASVSLWLTRREQQAIFVGLWVPSILALDSALAASVGDRN